MKKTPRVKRKPETHFEQIPIDVVKKIADREESKKKTAGSDNLIYDEMSMKTEPYTMPEWWLVRR
jgi:hypothetical protein